MSEDGTDWEPDDELEERPHGGRPHGGRPHGGRPHGGRPHGGRPHGGRPHGGRPHGGRPFGAESGGFLDPYEWSADIAEFFCERSAVVRLGADLGSTDDEIWITAFNPTVGFRGGHKEKPGDPPTIPVSLRPGDHVLEATVAVPDAIIRGFEASPERALTLKCDLAHYLAHFADAAFLKKGVLSGGISAPEGKNAKGSADKVESSGDVLQKVRDIVKTVRGRSAVAFRNPGWTFSQATLDDLSTLLTVDGLKKGAGDSVDKSRLLQSDGADGGILLGYPFVTSEAAARRIYFAADWQEAKVGFDSYFVTVDAPVQSAAAHETVIRASMSLDFALRRPQGFAWADAS